MPTNEEMKTSLAARLERWMESGEPVVSLDYMLPVVHGDMDLLKKVLLEWQKEGKIEWLLPFDPNDLKKPIVRFSHHINKHVPWRK